MQFRQLHEKILCLRSENCQIGDVWERFENTNISKNMKFPQIASNDNWTAVLTTIPKNICQETQGPKKRKKGKKLKQKKRIKLPPDCPTARTRQFRQHGWKSSHKFPNNFLLDDRKR